MIGIPRERLPGMSVWEVFPEGAGDAFFAALHRARDERRPVQLEHHHPAWQRWFEHRVHPTADGVSIFTTDITERKLAEAELHRAKEGAEAAERRSSFLADAGALLSSSLGYEATQERLIHLAVPRIADYCVLFEIDGPMVLQTAHAHVDPGKEPLLTRLGEIYRVGVDDVDNTVAEVARSGTAQLIQRSDADSLRSADGNAELRSRRSGEPS